MELHIFLGLMIPVAFFAFTGMVKSLVKSSWTWSNFYLGMDIALAALANGIVNIVDGVHQAERLKVPDPDFGNQMVYTSTCIVVSIGALLGSMGLHQRFDVEGQENGSRRLRRGILLGVVANILGMAALGMFIYMKLRRLV